MTGSEHQRQSPKNPHEVEINGVKWRSIAYELQYSNHQLCTTYYDEKVWYRTDEHPNNVVLHGIRRDKSDEGLRGRLHRFDGPAIERANSGFQEWFRDGRRHRENGPALIGGVPLPGRSRTIQYFLFGEQVTKKMVMNPEMLTKDEINERAGSPVINHLIHRLGSKFLETTGAKKIESSEISKLLRKVIGRIPDNTHGVLWQVELNSRGSHDPTRREVLRIVEVINGTSEPDGTYRHYFLRVPIDMPNANAAVAWTYGLSELEYERLSKRT